ncbi:MAG: hypothetical protein ABFC84_15035 [Veillonellales bacterium]
MYISLYDMGLFILFTVIVIAGCYLIAVLRRLFGLLGTVRDFFDAHNGDIGEMLSVLPKTLATVNELAFSVKNAIGQTSSALAPLQDDFINTVAELRQGLEPFLFYVKVIGKVFRRLFSK